MSSPSMALTALATAFRIPMRGYESLYLRESSEDLIVPNPHEGL